ncbi:MAG: RdgB/HAM1 family non-canonical purine NTP pyrophosphatase [Bacteroidia bacterium]
MSKLIFASQNAHKIKEIGSLLPTHLSLEGLLENGIVDELAETGTTLDENALQKARFVFQQTGKACFADDTGLEIFALAGSPGVYSARYAGEERDANKNMQKVLTELEQQTDRRAQFRTVIAWVDQTQELLFEGCVTGTILLEKRGEGGFGYDPIFRPDGFEQSFAEMTAAEKNSVSHRARALAKLIEFLKQKG